MTEPDDSARDVPISEAIEDFHRRRALGQHPRLEDYRERLGAALPEFAELLEAEAMLDRVMEPVVEDLPRPFGAYTLVRELGRGGVGIVYEAVDRRLGRTVALKILRSSYESDPTALARFEREAKACASVRHDHIVPIFESGDVDGQLYYAMDLVPGESLSARIKRGEPVDPKALCRQFAAIADALAALHAVGIVHRDVKPQNLMVRPDGRMVLADFGLARTADSAGVTQTGDAIGTPLYMSPEQMLGQRDEVDARTDVYGLGATIYEALSGRPPFRADSLHALMKMILADRPGSMLDVVPKMPHECDQIVRKALEKRREDRYADAAELAADLLAFADGQRVVGRPVSPAVRLLRGARRRWIPIAASVAAAVGAFAWWTHRSAEVVVSSWSPIATRVVLDGADRGAAPLSLSIAPGAHRLRLENGPQFQAQEVELVLAAGDRSYHVPSLMPVDASDKGAMDLLGAAMRLFPKGPTLPPGVRASPGEPPLLDVIFPRGDVRLADLDACSILVGYDFEAKDATLEFRRGDEVLASAPFAPGSRWSYLPIPAAVRSAARVGDVITWGVYPPKGASTKAVVAPIHVVDVDLDADLARIDAVLDPRAAGLRHAFRAELFHKSGLETAAFREAYAATKADPNDRLAWGTIVRALEAWGRKGSSYYADVGVWLSSPEPLDPKGAPTLEPSR